MPIARVQLPDGRVARLEVPDGTTPEQVQQFAESQFGQKREPMKSVDSGYSGPTGSFGENMMAGIGKSFVDTGRGLKQLGAQALNKVGLVSDQTVQGIQSDVDEARRLDKPLMHTGGGFVGNVLGTGAQFAVPGAAITKAAPVAALASKAGALAPYVAPAVSGGALAATQTVASDETRGGNVLLGAAGGAVGQGLAQGVGAVARGAKNAISPAVEDLAKAAEARGIPVTADQLLNSKPLNALRATLQYLPLSGAGNVEQTQKKALSKALSATIGESTDNVIAAANSAETRLGGEFDRVLKNTLVKADSTLQTDLARVIDDAAATLPDAQANVIRNQVDNLLSKVKAGDVIDGDAAYTIKKQLDRLAKSPDSSLAYAARDLRGTVFDALNRSLGPQESSKFATTREQWGNLRELQRLIPAGAEGDISAARLAQAKGRFRSQDLQELADIAGQFLKAREGNSGTAQRAGIMGALMGAGAVEPTTALASAAGGMTVGRAGNALLSSQFMRNYLTQGMPALEHAVPVTNALLPAAGAALPNAMRQ
jgi:hypothetical protein